MSSMYAEETKFAEELVKILNRQYSRHHFDSIVQYWIDKALETSGYTLSPPQNDIQVCVWTYHPERYGHCDHWETACDNAFQIDNPVAHGMEFCPYCGRRLEVKDE